MNLHFSATKCLSKFAIFPIVAVLVPTDVMAQVYEIGTDSGFHQVGFVPSIKIAESALRVGSAGTESVPHFVKRKVMPPNWKIIVTTISERHDIDPLLFEALVWQESRWNPAARSPKGAIGLTQLMPGTAQRLGVNPFDTVANLEGGARYLKSMLSMFNGDTRLALAAYNAGPARVLQYQGVPPFAETREYVEVIGQRVAWGGALEE